MKALFLLTLTIYCTSAFAELIDCGTVDIKHVYVQSDRDGSDHANKLLITFTNGKNSECNGFTHAYLENTDDAYNGTLSMAIAAYMAGKPLRIVVDGSLAISNARRIAWINL